MKEFIAAFVLIGIGIIGMAVGIICRKDGKFPDTDVGSNENMRKLGIRCFREEDQEMWDVRLGQRSAKCGKEFGNAACRSCPFFEDEKRIRGVI